MKAPPPPQPPSLEDDMTSAYNWPLPKFLPELTGLTPAPLPLVLAAYPRSGTSLLRRLLEDAFGVFTGSDTSPKKYLGDRLRALGFAGEGVVSPILV